MKPEEFQEIEEYLEEFSYTSMCYTEYEEVKHYEVICRTKKVIVISGYHQEAKCQECHWAANTPDDLLEVIKGKHFLVTFVPREWVTDFEKAGFQVRNAWHDYFMGNFADVPEYSQSMEILKKEECREASELTLSCCGQSRGFTGQTPEWMEEWVSRNKGVADNRIIMLEINIAGELLGI